VHNTDSHFPEEGWSGKCGNNEVTCDLPGYGVDGMLTFDWKHFSYEEYDDWLFGENGRWGNDTTTRAPDILIIEGDFIIFFSVVSLLCTETLSSSLLCTYVVCVFFVSCCWCCAVGLHTCMHAHANATTVSRHENEIPLLMRAVNGKHLLIYQRFHQRLIWCLFSLTQSYIRTFSLVLQPCLITHCYLVSFHHFITAAITRHKTIYGVQSMVIISTAGVY